MFAYGEALAGFLPFINEKLRFNKNKKHYKNLAGFTLGTGFGGGIVRNGELYIGDNGLAGEAALLRNKLNPDMQAEENISIRAIQRIYSKECKISVINAPSPKEIFEIGIGLKKGNKKAAIKAFKSMALVLYRRWYK